MGLSPKTCFLEIPMLQTETLAKPVMRVELLSHAFKVTHFDDRGKVCLLDFARGMTKTGLVRVGRNQFERRIVATFAAAKADRSEFRFHRNQFPEFLYHIARYGWSAKHLEVIERPLFTPCEVTHPLKDQRPPHDYQVMLADYLVAPCHPDFAPSKVVTLQTGKGKALPLYAKLKTPTGWMTMGEAKVGDVLSAPDGTTTRITAVYPQGPLQLYRVTFADGRAVECCAEHLWKVFYINTSPNQRWKVVNTMEMLRLISMPNSRVYVQLIEPAETPDAELPVDPYLLGLLLGDGCLRQGEILFSSADDFLLDQLKQLLPAGCELKHRDRYDYVVRPAAPLRTALQDLGVYDFLSQTKDIPKVYLSGSTRQRLALLQGLLDTDGTVQKSGSVSFCSTSFELARAVQYLVRSLGGIAALRPRSVTYTYGGVKKAGRLAYEVDIRYKRPSELFRLPRKLERVNDENQYAQDLKLRVISIVPSRVNEAQCIAVDHPDKLFITDDFIVTHNTFTDLLANHRIGQRAVLVIKGMYVDKWIADVEGAYHYKRGDLLVVRGSKDLINLMNLALAGELTAKFIIITSKTMYAYLKAYDTFNGVIESVYPISPDDFYEKLGVGVRHIDEVHQEFHANYRQDMYTHVPKTISLSATLDSDDPVLNRFYEVMWPLPTRAPEVAYDRYIAMVALWYDFAEPHKIRTLGATGQYDHRELEKSLIRHKTMLKNYLDMIAAIVDREFVQVFESGQSMLIYCGLTQMCTLVRDHLRARFPQLTVNRYTEEDSYEEHFLKGDIVVTTIQSAGTAVDRPNLRNTLMTVALSSKQSNIQVLGRTRRLKDWPNVTPKFIFLAARNIPKHVQYTKEKFQKLDGKVLSARELQTSFKI